MSAEPVRLVVADDHPVFRAGIRVALEKGDQITVVAEAEDGEEALKAVREHQPDVLLLDMNMPGMGGPEVAAELANDGFCVSDQVVPPISGSPVPRAGAVQV